DAYYFARRYDEAIQQYGEVLEMDPGFREAHNALGQAYEKKGRYDEALVELLGGPRVMSAEDAIPGYLGRAYALAGRAPEARAIAKRMIRASSSGAAMRPSGDSASQRPTMSSSRTPSSLARCEESSESRSVRTIPGSTVRTRIPRGPSSRAASRRNATAAGRSAFEVESDSIGSLTLRLWIETKAEPGSSSGAAARTMRTTAMNVPSKLFRQSSSPTSSARPGGGPPALATQPG